MVADFLTGYTSDQAYLAFVALLLPRLEYGGFRAATSLMGPTVVILLAGGNIGLPEATRRVDPTDPEALRRFARQLTVGTSACIVGYGVVVAIAGPFLLTALYGQEFARFSSLATLAAVGYILMVSVFGQGIALKAAGRMRRLWRARLVVAGASLVSMVLLVHWLHTTGAGWAAVATGAYYAAGVYTVYRLELRGPGAPSVGDGASVSTMIASMVPGPVGPDGAP
jgi:O-antigen/teichoic acid export membrane protein